MRKVFRISLFLLFLSLILGIIYLHLHLNRLAKKELITFLSKQLKTDSIEIKSFRINLWTQSLAIKETRIKFSYLVENKELKVAIEIPQVKLGLTRIKEILDRKVTLDRFIISSPSVSLEELFSDSITQLISSNKQPVHPPIDVHIEHFEIQNFSFSSLKNNDHELTTHLHLLIENLSLQQNDSLQLNYKTINLSADSLCFRSKKRQKVLKTGRISWNGNKLIAKSLSFRPIMNKRTFYARARKAKNYLQLSAQHLELDSLLLNPKNLQKGVSAKTLRLDSFQIDSYKNLGYPRDMRPKSLPIKYLEPINIPIHIDNVSLSNSSILHKQNYSFRQKAAYIQFKNIEASIRSFTYPPPSGSDSLVIGFSSKIYGRLPLKGRLALSYKSKYQAFSLDARLKKAPLATFNPIIERTATITVKNGNLLGASMRMVGNNYKLRGSIDVEYDNLKFAILKRDTYTLDSSFLAWGIPRLSPLIIRTKNKKGSRRYRQGEILYYRASHNSFPNYLWRGVATGLFDIAAKVARKRKPLSNLPNHKKKHK